VLREPVRQLREFFTRKLANRGFKLLNAHEIERRVESNTA
jgi:hypothetical protein